MTMSSGCHHCGVETTRYVEAEKRWDCGCRDTRLYTDVTHARKGDPEWASNIKPFPPKFMKLLRTGRWTTIEKTGRDGKLYPVGVRRKSTGEERYL